MNHPKRQSEGTLLNDLNVVAFEFAPGDFVTVTHLGLNHRGRVARCILTVHGRHAFDVEYNSEGSLLCREFWEDEIEPRKL